MMKKYGGHKKVLYSYSAPGPGSPPPPSSLSQYRMEVENMTEQDRKRFELCNRWQGCNASVCPLYSQIEDTHFIAGDKKCSKIVDYLENVPMPEELRLAIAESELRWRAVLGEGLLARWQMSRKAAKEYFKKAV
jgi:hypothetical protein